MLGAVDLSAFALLFYTINYILFLSWIPTQTFPWLIKNLELIENDNKILNDSRKKYLDPMGYFSPDFILWLHYIPPSEVPHIRLNYILAHICHTLHTTHCTLHTAHCTLHTAHCTLHTAHCTLHTAHCTPQTKQHN